MSAPNKANFIIIGGGLGGALMANYLGRAGYHVDVYEMRDDPRKRDLGGGRSINLAISHRGICALQEVDLAEKVLRMAVPMPGRMIHALDGSLSFQPYGKDVRQAINSVSRNDLNVTLLNGAERYPNVQLLFNRKCIDADAECATVDLVDTQSGERSTVHGDVLISADGAFSVVRRSMQRRDRFNYSQDYLEHGYKELTIPAGPEGKHRIEKHALHIWPRRSFMMIALPNADGSFTCTLFWPLQGANSFAAINNEAVLTHFFNRQFPDAVPLMPTLAEDYFTNPVGSLVTIRCGPWHVDGKTVLLGDAAHAVVPFYGQGANAAFEDVLILSECMERHRPDWADAFRSFYELRKEHVDALADLAVANFIEMRDHTGSRVFLAKKKAEHTLHKLLPWWYLPLYTMVTFTRMPYGLALRRAHKQHRIAGVVLGILALLLASVALLWLRS